METIRTFVTAVGFQSTTPDGNACFKAITYNGRPVYWLDSLLGGEGLVIPKGISDFRDPPLLWLVSGPPGTGKSKFALELCYRLSTNSQIPGSFDSTLSTAYCSFETDKPRLLETMKSFGWQVPPPNGLKIAGRDEMRFSRESITPLVFFQRLLRFIGQDPVHLVVIDSLNVHCWPTDPNSPSRDATGIIHDLREAFKGHAWIIILVQDLTHGEGQEPRFAFEADIETRFGEVAPKDYTMQTFRIVKMRDQEHARGDQVIKIYGKPGAVPGKAPPATDQVGVERPDGGVYIFPSVHRQLSGAHRLDAPAPTGAIPPPVESMASIMPLGKDPETGQDSCGFPKGRCTALVGERGALKSHLAYLTLLKALKGDDNMRAVMLSLRDDNEAATQTLAHINEQESVGIDVQGMLQQGRLDIVHFWPGYIPPGEFMHRVVVAIQGAIQREPIMPNRPILVVLDGIDQLAARHPLCAEERMFVPALVSYLKMNSVTSLVIAATDQRGTIEASGLLPMAELVLKFVPEEDTEACPPEAEQFVKLVAVRVPSGGISGRHGILYRNHGKLSFQPTHTVSENPKPQS
jgi:KaiC/GvpD/RAD55 family RecA-like ATPase